MKYMCQICFCSYAKEDLFTDEAGDTWDICKVCEGNERHEMIRRGL